MQSIKDRFTEIEKNEKFSEVKRFFNPEMALELLKSWGAQLH